MESIEIKIRSSADLRALENTKRALEQERTALTALGKDSSAVETKLNAVNHALSGQAAAAIRAADASKRAKEEMAKIGKGGGPSVGDGVKEGLQDLPGGGVASKLLSGPAAATAATIAALAEGVAAFIKAEEAVARMDTALAQTGHLTEENRQRFQELAKQLEETTTIGQEEWMAVLTRLTQFGANPETIGMDVDAVKNLAGLLGGDVARAANVYSRALQGNFETLKRLGVAVDENATKCEQLAQIQEQLARRGGGQLEASARTISGEWKNLKNGADDLLRAFGAWISQTGVLQSVLSGLGSSLAWVAELIGGTIPPVHGLRNAVTSTIQPIEDAAMATDAMASGQSRLKAAVADADAELRKQIALLKDVQRQRDEMADARQALAVARIDAAEASGKISKEQAILLKAAARETFEAQRFKNAQDTAAGEIAAKKGKIRDNESEQGEKTAQIGQIQANQKAAAEIAKNRADLAASEQKKNQEFWDGQIAGLDAWKKGGMFAGKWQQPQLGLEFDPTKTTPEEVEAARREMEKRSRRGGVESGAKLKQFDKDNPMPFVPADPKKTIEGLLADIHALVEQNSTFAREIKAQELERGNQAAIHGLKQRADEVQTGTQVQQNRQQQAGRALGDLKGGGAGAATAVVNDAERAVRAHDANIAAANRRLADLIVGSAGGDLAWRNALIARLEALERDQRGTASRARNNRPGAR